MAELVQLYKDKAKTQPITPVISSESLIDLVYPIGSIYISVNSVNPSTFIGGTWEAWGTGRTIVGIDTKDTNFNTVEKTGGEATHTLSTSEMPSHGGHLLQEGWNGYGSYFFDANKALSMFGSGAYGWKIEAGNEIRPYREITGGSQAHNNLQPYITCYMWKRTA